jgi:hypothetical protein
VSSALTRRYGRPSKLVAGARVKLVVDDEMVTGRMVEVFDAEGRRMLRIELDQEKGEPAAVVEAPAKGCKPFLGGPAPILASFRKPRT